MLCNPSQWRARVRASGQATVEFAFVAVLLFGAMMLVIEGARMTMSYFAVGNAAAEGARAGEYTTATDSSIQTAARRALEPWVQVPNLDASGSCSGSNVVCICRRTTPDAACGTTPIQNGSVLEVTVKYDFNLLPLLGGFIQRSGPWVITGYKRVTIE
ncbi:MAG TPA: TadE family protein [Chloroflexota bacterium]|jgi:Flp pilus assembly protein TadG